MAYLCSLKREPIIHRDHCGHAQEQHSAIMFATLDGRLEIVQLLIRRKADVNHRNKVMN